MSDEGNNKSSRMSWSQLLKLIVGIVVFAVLMAIRTESEQVWLRALVAACAGGVFG